MTRRAERSLEDLYRLTARISIPEITPVLEGICRIQGPVQEADQEIGFMRSSVISADKGPMSMKEKARTRVESGTCNVCSAPCSSCMHFNRAMSFTESNMEGSYSFNNFSHKDSRSVVDAVVRRRECGKSASEMSAGPSSSYDSYSGIAESVSTLMPTSTDDTYVAIRVPLTESLHKVDEHLLEGSNAPAHLFTSFTKTDEVHQQECLGDNILGLSAAACPNSGQLPVNCDAAEKGVKLIGLTNNCNLPSTGVNKEAQVDDPLDNKVVETLLGCRDSVLVDLEVLKYRSLASSTVNDLQEKSACAENTSLGICQSKMESSRCNAEESFADGISVSAPIFDACSEVQPAACNVASPSRNVPFPESNHGKDSAVSTRSSNVRNCTIVNNNSSHEAFTSSGRIDIQAQSLSEGERSYSDEIEEHDVKVCDICGDAGREECLAICSRCSDGAEHIYCMRIMLKKVPEGEWLCEECKLKEESENKKTNKTELGLKTSRMPSVKESTENSDCPPNAQALHMLGGRLVLPVAKGSNKGENSMQLTDKKQSDQLGTRPSTGKRSSDASGVSVAMASPKKKAAVSQEGILRPLDSGKLRANNVAAVSSSPKRAVVSNLPKNQTPQAPHGSFLRSSSFNNGSSVRGKVRQLTGNIPAIQSMNKGSSPRESRKELLLRLGRKTLPLGRPSTVFSNPIAVNKAHSLNSSRSDDMVGLKSRTDREFLEKRKNFSERPSVIPVPSTTCIPSKSDVKLDVVGTSKVLDSTNDSGRLLRRSQSCIVKSPQTGPSDSESPKELQIPKRIIQAGIIATPSPSILRATPQASHACPINKLCAPVLSDQSSQEWMGKNNNKFEKKIAILTEHRADFPVINDELPLGSAITKSNPVFCSSRTKKSPDIVHESTNEQLDVKRAVEPEQATGFLSKWLRLSVIPELNFVWQGDFEVLKSGKTELCGRVQAHLSSCVSPKVLSLVDKFPDRVMKLDEVPCSSAWPLQFERAGPREEHIALFFFAKDLESYEKHYQKLLGNMLENDLALRGNIGGVKLLIFASNKLPVNSQRWNSLLFLWGVFRGRNPFPLETTNDTREKSCEFDLEEPLIPRPSSPVPCNDSISLNEYPNKKIKHNPTVFDNKSAIENVVGFKKEKDFGPEKEDDFNKDSVNMLCPVLPSLENGTRRGDSINSCPDSSLQEPVLHDSLQSEKKSISGDLENPKEQKPPWMEETDLTPASLPVQPIVSDQGAIDKIVVKEEVKIETLVPAKCDVLLDLNEAEDPTERDFQDWEDPTVCWKHEQSCSVDTFSRASGEELNWKDESFDDEVEHKKIKLSSFSENELDLGGSRFSSQVHLRSLSLPPESPRSLGSIFFHEAKIPESSTRSNDRHLLSLGLSPSRDTRTENLIYIISSDDEDSLPGSSTPDLELALGGRKGGSSRKSTLQSLSPFVDNKKGNRDELPAYQVVEDVPLSLSLAFPTVAAAAASPEKDHQPVAIKAAIPQKTEPLLPGKPRSNTSFLLFGYTNT